MNCDTKDDTFAQESKQKSPIEHISLSDFHSDIKSNESSERLKPYFDVNRNNNQLTQSKGITNDDLTIITDEIIKITKNDTIYYTFKTFTPLAKNNEFYNLIVYVNRKHEIFNIELLRYTPEISWLADIKKPYRGTVAKIEHEISMRSGITTNWSFSGIGGCIKSVSVDWLCDFGKDHAPGEGENCTSWTATVTLNFGPCPNENEEEVEVIVDLPSPSGGGGATPNGTPTIPSPPCKEVVGEQTIGITDGSGGCLDNIIPFDEALLNLTAEMSLNQTNWWNDVAKHVQQTEILNYINNHVDFNAAISFALQFIEQSRLNSTLNLDFEASTKSPANIDRSAINNNTPEGQRFNEVYDALKNVPEFKALFTDIFDEPQTRLNVKFEIHEHVYHISPNGQESFEVAANISSYNNQNNNNYIIKVSKQGLIPSGSFYQNKLENAQTIAHEAAHAFLNNLFKNPNSIATIQNIDQKNLKEILDALQSANPNQHEIIFNNLTETIAQILSSLKDVLTTPAQRAIVEDLQIPESQDPENPNSQIWDWDTYFQYLSYIGLQGTIGFNAQFPPDSDALNKFTLYITYGRAYLNL
jgi:hypothetical protein